MLSVRMPCSLLRPQKIPRRTLSQFEAAPDLSCRLDPLHGVLASFLGNLCVKVLELRPAALQISDTKVLAAGALVLIHGMGLADTVCCGGTLVQGCGPGWLCWVHRVKTVRLQAGVSRKQNNTPACENRAPGQEGLLSAGSYMTCDMDNGCV